MSKKQQASYAKLEIINTTLKLLKERELSDISISEICQHALVGRNSFYRNFNSKEDIICNYILIFLDDWVKLWAKEYDPTNQLKLYGHLFSYLKEHEDFMKLLYDRKLFYLFRETYLESQIPKDTVDNKQAYITAFIGSGMIGWIEEWIKRGMMESGEVMIQLLLSNNIQGDKQ